MRQELTNCSFAGCSCSLGNHSYSSDDHVYCWRVTDLWYDYQLWPVFPGGAGILVSVEADESDDDWVELEPLLSESIVQNSIY